MGQLNQTIQIKNVIDFYNIKNFVETGTGKAEVVQTVVELSLIHISEPTRQDASS